MGVIIMAAEQLVMASLDPRLAAGLILLYPIYRHRSHVNVLQYSTIAIDSTFASACQLKLLG